jgi:hypothetical protein
MCAIYFPIGKTPINPCWIKMLIFDQTDRSDQALRITRLPVNLESPFDVAQDRRAGRVVSLPAVSFLALLFSSLSNPPAFCGGAGRRMLTGTRKTEIYLVNPNGKVKIKLEGASRKNARPFQFDHGGFAAGT